MPKKNPPPKDEKPQSERFKDMARELQVDETGQKFEQVVRKVLPRATHGDGKS
jgi:hypothetical protein